MGDYGEFEEVVDPNKVDAQAQQQPGAPSVPNRIRMPKDGELMGKVIQLLGGNRMDIKCTDGKMRNCRVPGRYKRRMWLRVNHVVIIQPWEGNDDRADIIYQYPPAAANQLRKKGMLDSLKTDF